MKKPESPRFDACKHDPSQSKRKMQAVEDPDPFRLQKCCHGRQWSYLEHWSGHALRSKQTWVFWTRHLLLTSRQLLSPFSSTAAHTFQHPRPRVPKKRVRRVRVQVKPDPSTNAIGYADRQSIIRNKVSIFASLLHLFRVRDTRCPRNQDEFCNGALI